MSIHIYTIDVCQVHVFMVLYINIFNSKILLDVSAVNREFSQYITSQQLLPINYKDVLDNIKSNTLLGATQY